MNRKVFSQAGSSLIEVMIALFVLAVGMLGVLAMQTHSIKTSRNSSLFSLANIYAGDIVEAMRSSPSAPTAYEIEFGASATSSVNCTTSDCTPVQIADWNLMNWRTNVENSLPGGQSQIALTNSGSSVDGNVYTITIRFNVGFHESTNEALIGEVEVTAVF